MTTQDVAPDQTDALGRLRATPVGDTASKFFLAMRGYAKTTAVAAGNGVERGVRTVTMRDYRDSAEGAIAQLVEVAAVHEAEIATLRDQVAALTARVEGGRSA